MTAYSDWWLLQFQNVTFIITGIDYQVRLFFSAKVRDFALQSSTKPQHLFNGLVQIANLKRQVTISRIVYSGNAPIGGFGILHDLQERFIIGR